MRTNVSNYYDLMTFGLGDVSFQSFVDKFKLKYNTLNVYGGDNLSGAYRATSTHAGVIENESGVFKFSANGGL